MSLETDLYPTRVEHERILERADPVVYGLGEKRSPNGLEREQVESYEKNGFLVLPGLFSAPEVTLLLEEFRRLGKAEELRGREELIREPDGDVVRSIFDLHRFSKLFDRLSRDRRILDKVTQLLGSQAYLHHDRINIKPAYHGKSFPWHSDFETWHAEDGIARCRMLTGWIMLTANTEFNGPLYLVPGSHKRYVSCVGKTPEDNHKASLRKQEYGVPSEEAVRQLVVEGGMAGACGPAGTLVFHEANILHGSTDNISPWPRINLMFVYNSVENTPLDKPFGAARVRPAFLRSTDFKPLEPVENCFK
jgi:ectoine hydroxylase